MKILSNILSKKKKSLKFLSDSLIFFAIGIIVGGALVYIFFNTNNNSSEAAAYLKFKEIRAAVTPSGIPEIYGDELNLSFDKVQESMNIMVPYGPTYGQEGKKIVLTGADLERYKNIGSQIACEYCCGVKTLT